MSTHFLKLRRLPLLAALALLPLTTPNTARAQFGAIAMVPDQQTTADGTPLVMASSPVLAESALILPQGRMGVGGFLASSGDFSLFNGGVSYAITDRLMLGATFTSYSFPGVDIESDLDVTAKFQFWRSPDTRSLFAATGVVGSDGTLTWFGLGGAFSHVLDQFSIHGSARVISMESDVYSATTTDFSAAAVVPLARQLWLSGGVVGHSDGEETTIYLAPGARIGLGRNLFVDGGAVLQGEHTAFLVGMTLVP